ncbi:hypothetical protein AVEN_206291-1 [Araneus ventricosus]|uniref:Uncharacterized protein n=1 Tax=Araneus ventricosus TaxID=182803 RepID=A0A4Y2SQV2_ARAVE|nr:hypothetical protein AVEN_253651-1 [Araneus ventricosus]GBN90686.1 hypothetical protein AVEN_206291-1 [Araneus ventricosus]
MRLEVQAFLLTVEKRNVYEDDNSLPAATGMVDTTMPGKHQDIMNSFHAKSELTRHKCQKIGNMDACTVGFDVCFFDIDRLNIRFNTKKPL